MDAVGGRRWVTREEIAEIHDARAHQMRNALVKSMETDNTGRETEEMRLIERMLATKANARDIRWTANQERESGRRALAEAMDSSRPVLHFDVSYLLTDWDWEGR